MFLYIFTIYNWRVNDNIYIMFKYYLFVAPLIAIILIVINLLLSYNNKYIEKNSPFECGFTSYKQSRSSINVTFIIVAILFLPFDLEISSLLPYVISAYNNGIYGLIIVMIFIIVLVIVFIYELKLDIIKLSKSYAYTNKDLYL